MMKTCIFLWLALSLGWSFAEEKEEGERLMPENPSVILGSEEQQVNNLVSQVGRAVITEEEKEAKRTEAERIAKLEAAERAKEEARLARIAKRKSGSKLPPEECKGYTGQPSHTISRGDTLGKVASEIYGNSAYSILISIVNKKPANKLFIGDKLLTPSPYEVFTKLDGKAVHERYPYAIRDILSFHERFKAMESTLLREKASGDGYSEKTKETLDQMLWEMDQVKKDFFEKQEGINEFPVSTTTQLHSAYTNLRSIRRGDLGTKNLRLQRVHLYLLNGYSYAIAWGRDGFKTKKD